MSDVKSCSAPQISCATLCNKFVIHRILNVLKNDLDDNESSNL